MEKQTQALNVKAQKFQDFLAKNEIKAFTVETADDELQSAVFRSRMEVGGQELPAVVVIDNSIYAMIRVQIVGGVVKGDRYPQVVDFVNRINRQYKIFKYYVTENGDLCLDCCLAFTEENFEGELVRTVINVVLQHLTEQYAEIMRVVWAAPAEAAK